MDRADKPPLSSLSGQLKLGLQEEDKKEALWEDLLAFGRGLLFYLYRRVFGLLGIFGRFALSGFTLTDQLKFWLSRKFVRRKGQLSFPFAHVTLIGVSLSLLVVTASLGDVIFESSDVSDSQANPFILESGTELVTEESKLTQTKVFTYTVEEGDDLYEIAKRFIRTPDDIASANNLKTGKDGSYRVSPGRVLTIPPLEGLTYEVRPGDTVEKIAKRYSADPQSVIELNYLFGSYTTVLKDGLKLFIPTPTGAQLTASSLDTALGSCGQLKDFGWPTKSHTIIGSYTFSHRAIDLPADFEELYAPADGTVVAAGGSPAPCFSFGPGCNYGYGGYVFIDIGDGYQVRYGHIREPKVGRGQKVKKGAVVAISGESGVAYGPHLHFELLCNGQKISPLPFLK